jgi:modulator of FtsH protease
MALYDRDYAQGAQGVEQQAARQAALSTFIKKTYQLFAASLLAGAAGAYVGLDFAMQIARFGFWMLLPMLGLLFAVQFARKVTGLNYILLFAFTFVTGLAAAPLIAINLASPSGGAVVMNAFIMTTVAFGGLSVFAMNTKRNFTTMGKMLFIVLLVLIVAMLLNAFVAQSTMLSLVISSVAAILFSAYILYDTQNIIRGAYETPIEGAIALYLDFWNLFISLLNILGILNRE